MYHRRLVLLLGMVLIGLVGLAAQLTRLTVVQGAALREEAESRLINQRWSPTYRGRILDRAGRVLAEDRPSFDLTVDYRVITGTWAVEQAGAAARRASQRSWPKLSQRQRDRLIEAELPAFEARLESMWRTIADVSGEPRERIDQRRQEIIASVQRMSTAVWARRLEKERRTAQQREAMLELADVARPIREQRSPHVILRQLDDETAFRFRELAEEFPGLAVIDAGDRAYPHERMMTPVDLSTLPAPIRRDEVINVRVDGVATHILGWMRSRVLREDMIRRPLRDPETGEIDRGHYQLGDSVGSAGVEATLEDELRGLRGRVTRQLDTGERSVIPAAPGKDVRLTIDIALQARLHALFDPEIGLAVSQPWHNNDDLETGAALNGAAVVIDVETGELLAMVSHPTFTREQLQEDPDSVFRDPVNQAWVNRPLARAYQPGSIVKPLVFTEAVTQGVHAQGNHIECHGHFLPDRPNIYRCWIYRPQYGYATHTGQLGGALSGSDAICVSCNIYFYTLGRHLGPERIAEMYRRYGVRSAYEVGLSGAFGGFLGRIGGAPITLSESVMMGIGQGPVSWTPLHAADAYATLARRGVRISPRLVKERDATRVDRGLSPDVAREALRGIERVVNDPLGTAHHLSFESGRDPLFNARGVTVSAKTGTAQAAPTFFDPSGDTSAEEDNPNIARRGDHSWTVGLVGPTGAPHKYAFAVVVEHGGSGGRVSGPIANQVVHALIAEGYLPDAGSNAEAGS